jgi:predicted nucleic acid-binding protein
MRKTVYIETSIPSYLSARPSRDVRAAAWQQITWQWWEEARPRYDLFTSELVIAEASLGDRDAAGKRMAYLDGISGLPIDEEVQALAERLIAEGSIPAFAQADALHVAVAAVHRIEYLLTWNCRHLDNAATKPLMRSICAVAGYVCPEICTPLELLSEESDNVPR